MPKRIPQLTESVIRKVKPADKPRYLFDGGGLFLVIGPDGSRRWRWKYTFQGKPGMLSMGTYPVVSLVEARKKRDEARALLAAGTDPSAARKEEKTGKAIVPAETFRDFALEYYGMREKAGTKGKHRKLSPASMKVIYSVLRRDVFPWIGEIPLTCVTRDDCEKVLERILNREAVVMAHTAG